LDTSSIKRIKIVVDDVLGFPELAIIYTNNLCLIQLITKNLLDEIICSGINYTEKKKHR
jgi:hypothetical protein